MLNNYSFFWEWFVAHKNMLANLKPNDSLIEEIDKNVNSLGDFIWEIGPGFNKLHSFTISPGGEVSLLEQTKKIISYAPKLIDWEFHYAKRAKEWSNYFNIFLSGGTLSIDLSKWEYVLLEYYDQTFDIIIKPEPYLNELENEIYGIVEMILDSIIGEEIRLETIKYIEIVKKFDDELITNNSLLINLAKHINKLRQ